MKLTREHENIIIGAILENIHGKSLYVALNENTDDFFEVYVKYEIDITSHNEDDDYNGTGGEVIESVSVWIKEISSMSWCISADYDYIEKSVEEALM